MAKQVSVSSKARSRVKLPEAKGDKPDRPDTDNLFEDLKTLIDTLGVTNSFLYHNSFVSRSTIRNARNGKTRKPMSLTLQTLGEAIGYELTWKRRKYNG
jgi:hypothetical protein